MLIEPTSSEVTAAIDRAAETCADTDIEIVRVLMRAYLDRILRPRVKPKPGRN